MPFGRSGILLLTLGEMWEVWLPKKVQFGVATVYEGEKSEDTSSEEYCEHSVDSLAIEVVWAELVK